MQYLKNHKVIFLVFIAIAGYFLWTEHHAHISMAIPYLPYLLILLCLLMHIFMHHGHGHDHRNSTEVKDHNPNPTGSEQKNADSSRKQSLPWTGDDHA